MCRNNQSVFELVTGPTLFSRTIEISIIYGSDKDNRFQLNLYTYPPWVQDYKKVKFQCTV